MQVLILGAGEPIGEAGAIPLWLAEQHGQLLIERLVRRCQPLGQLVFAARRADIRRYHLDNVVARAAADAKIIAVAGQTQGAACTALLCVDHIEPDAPLVIVNGNEVLDANFQAIVDEFEARGLDAGVVTFPSIHPFYSYVRLDENDLVIEAAEKDPISNHAVVGFYWFRKGSDFLEAVMDMIRKDARVDNKFYVSLVLNELVLRDKKVGCKAVDASRYHPLKSARHLMRYEAGLPADLSA
jgi:hypothetical protein